MKQKREWFTPVGCGSGPKPARGPFTSTEAALAAVERFRQRYGQHADTYLRSGSVRIAGPYPTRAKAAKADISDAGTAASVWWTR